MDPNAAYGRRRFCALLTGTGTAALSGWTARSSLTTHTNETTRTIGPDTDGLTEFQPICPQRWRYARVLQQP